MNIKEKISTKNGPKTKGAYSPALKVCEQMYISGQLPIDPTTNQVVEGGIKEQMKRCETYINHLNMNHHNEGISY